MMSVRICAESDWPPVRTWGTGQQLRTSIKAVAITATRAHSVAYEVRCLWLRHSALLKQLQQREYSASFVLLPNFKNCCQPSMKMFVQMVGILELSGRSDAEFAIVFIHQVGQIPRTIDKDVLNLDSNGGRQLAMAKDACTMLESRPLTPLETRF